VAAGEEGEDRDAFLAHLEQEFTGWSDAPTRLMEALEEEQLELHAQPIASLVREGEVPMAEVLVRMREGATGLLPPAMFFPAFRHCGLMHELDFWVARRAIARLARGTRIPCLVVNVSIQTLGEREFLPAIAAEVGRAGVAPASLVFEIGDGDVHDRHGAAEEFAGEAHAAGFQLLLQGFGRHSASAAPIRTLKVSHVKMDGAIVRGLATSDIARHRLEAIVRMSEMLRVGVIAEYVESNDILARLRAAGVQYAQGFAIGAPAPIDQVLG
jgi:EAL domain-containing protein (putative c-di-GMP-specific phosphodiesterase class I)